MAMIDSNRSIPDILKDLVSQVASLARNESRLARAEVSEKVGQVAGGLALLVLGAVLMIPALTILLGAAVTALIDAGMTPQLAAAIAGGIAFLVGVILLFVGANRLKVDNLVPNKTLRQFQHDAAVAKQQMRQDHAEQRAA